MNPKKIIFLTIGDSGYSRSWNYFNALDKKGLPVEFLKLNRKNLIKDFIIVRKRTNRDDVFVVMSPSQILVPFVKFFLGNKIIMDSGWSLFEGTILTRRKFGLFGKDLFKIYGIDYIASRLAKKIVLESHAQKEFYAKLFFVNSKKCSVIYTGIDEEQFKINKKYQQPLDFFNNSKIVLYRGKYTVEAGLEVLASATRILESEEITFWVLSPGIPNNIKFSKNTFILSKFVDSKQDIAKLYSKATLTLGQLSSHPRLRRTIPHRAYESAFLSKPYLSARADGILELFSENKEILCFNPGDSFDLAGKIKLFFENYQAMRFLGDNLNLSYNSVLTQSKLADSFNDLIEQVK